MGLFTSISSSFAQALLKGNFPAPLGAITCTDQFQDFSLWGDTSQACLICTYEENGEHEDPEQQILPRFQVHCVLFFFLVCFY